MKDLLLLILFFYDNEKGSAFGPVFHRQNTGSYKTLFKSKMKRTMHILVCFFVLFFTFMICIKNESAHIALNVLFSQKLFLYLLLLYSYSYTYPQLAYWGSKS